MAVVKDFYDGPCHIRIHDDCCVKTQEEVDQLLKEIAEIAKRAYQAQKIREEELLRQQEEQNKLEEQKQREEKDSDESLPRLH